MDLWTVDVAVAVTTEILLLALLVNRAIYRTLPVFFIYTCWAPLCDGGLYITSLNCSPADYFHIYLVQLVIDSLLMFAVLVELAWSLLQPIRAMLPRFAWVGIAVVVALAGLLLWPVAGWTHTGQLTSSGVYFFRLQHTVALLRVVIFLAMAGFSHALLIGWRNRELQIATGLGLYSLISLGIDIAHMHQAVGAQYHWLDYVDASSYICVLFYWVVCFSTKEAERQEFTPHMREFLLAAAGATRTTRMAMMQSQSDRENDRRKR
jgi:hypothetical protein